MPGRARTGTSDRRGPSKASCQSRGLGTCPAARCGQANRPGLAPRLAEGGSSLAFPRRHRAHPRNLTQPQRTAFALTSESQFDPRASARWGSSSLSAERASDGLDCASASAPAMPWRTGTETLPPRSAESEVGPPRAPFQGEAAHSREAGGCRPSPWGRGIGKRAVVGLVL